LLNETQSGKEPEMGSGNKFPMGLIFLGKIVVVVIIVLC
jgi:hypothetical protein